MGAPELLALSLGLSIGVAVLAWAVARSIDGLGADPALSDRVWAVALDAPLLPPLAVAALLLTPAPVRDVVVAAPIETVALLPVVEPNASPPATHFAPNAAGAAWAVLILAGTGTLTRLTLLALRTRRLRRLVRHARPAHPLVAAVVDEVAHRMGVAPPVTLVSADVPDAMLANLGRTRLILPASLIDDPDALRTMIAHEAAHLKRGDHRRLWLEEFAVAALAFNPLVPALRARRDAARERACDALALAGAGQAGRRAYARTLVHALKARAGPRSDPLPTTTFTGINGKLAMKRLQAILTPAAPAVPGLRLAAAAATLAMLAGTGVAAFAVAAQRAPTERLVFAEVASQAAVRSPTPSPVASPTAPAPRAPTDGVAQPKLRPAAPTERSTPGAAASADQDPPQDRPPTPRPLPADRLAHYRAMTAEGYQQVCVSGDAMDRGVCAGMMLAYLHGAPENGVCAPAAVIDDRGDGRSLGAFVEGGLVEVARLRPEGGETPQAFAGRALRAAYPCDA